MKFSKLVGLLVLFFCFIINAQAQSDYPNKPIKMIVGFAPGGGSDFIARMVAVKMGKILGQPIIIDNKPGAGGNLAAEMALRSPPDGYTIFLTAASYTVNPSFYKLPFNSLKDITPISLLAKGPFIIAVNPDFPANNLKEMVDAIKKNPGKYSYASAGNGSIVHMVSEYFFDIAGVTVDHVPYKGTSPALTDTIAGHTQIVFGTVASTLPFVKSGKLKALAVSTPKRLPALPNIPTASESGYPSYQVTNWHGLIGPKGIPKEIQMKLNKVVNQALNEKEIDVDLASDGLAAAGDTPEAFQALLISETARWASLAKKRDLKAN
jgi:tripartite-type tricarboxylate transporter receptor subunit TctC